MRHLYFNLKDLFSNRKGFVILTSLLRFKNKSREFREYQVPVNRPPFLTPTLHPMTPLFYSVHTQWPPFSHFCIKFYIKIANFCALCPHFEKFNDFVAILTENLQILPWNCIFAHWMTPIFGSPHQKSPHFFGAHTEWPPFFDEILHRMPPIFVFR